MPRDFFVSFNAADRKWATWIAWVLEEHGYTVFFQDWDFRGNFVEHMHRSHQEAERTLAVLSNNYFGSDFTLAEWSARLAEDPAGKRDLLVPVKVAPFEDAGILKPLVHADLTSCNLKEAERRLVQRVKMALDPDYRPKPPGAPLPPNARQVEARPSYPGQVTMPSWLLAAGGAAMVALAIAALISAGEENCVINGVNAEDITNSNINVQGGSGNKTCD